MGAWGAGLFQDDIACDLRDEFAELLADGKTAEAATAELERRYDPAGDAIDVEPVFWIALAATQHRWGRLIPATRDRAIEIIDSGRDLDRFTDEGKIDAGKIDGGKQRADRAKTLARLKADLLGPARSPRPIKPAKKVDTPWRIGEVWRYRLPSGRACLFRVVDHKQDKGGRYAVFEVLANETGALHVALSAGQRDKDGRHHTIIVPRDLDNSPRISATDLGRSSIASLMHRLRTWSQRSGRATLSVILVGKLDFNLKASFGLE